MLPFHNAPDAAPDSWQRRVEVAIIAVEDAAITAAIIAADALIACVDIACVGAAVVLTTGRQSPRLGPAGIACVDATIPRC